MTISPPKCFGKKFGKKFGNTHTDKKLKNYLYNDSYY